MMPATDSSTRTRSIGNAYACMIGCEHVSIVLDFVIERLYDVGIPSGACAPRSYASPPSFAGVHIHSANSPTVGEPRLSAVRGGKPCPGAMEKWCL